MAAVFGIKWGRQQHEPDLPHSPADDSNLEEISGLSNLYSPEQQTAPRLRDIADILHEMGKLTDSQLAALRQAQQKSPNRELADLIREQGLADAEAIAMARASLYGFEFRRIQPDQVEQDAFKKLPLEYIKSNRVAPIAIDGSTLVVATSRPTELFVIEDVKRQTHMDVETVVCLDEDIDKLCAAFDDQTVDYNLDEIISDMTDVEILQDEQEESEDLERMAGASPVIKFVNYLISNAVREGASDIHIEPKEKCMKTRYRIDGVLFEVMQSPLKMHPAIVSRIKIMANLDISERRLPQDGKISVMVGGRAVDLRVSTLPTSHGEKVVIRVLDSRSALRDMEQLGMEPDVREAFRRQISLPHGIFLVTGPTGSGKSTTLYAALSQMDGERLNISTVEDPVEYELDFCNQVQINEKIGLDFATALRSLLRQDPDVIMIGEIRDNETARIAVQAALTGHLVLSTLHTNDAASSVTRLVNIGIDPYLIAASLNGVLAQRLVRRICPKCKQPYDPPERILSYLRRVGVESQPLYRGTGCQSCRGSGYTGRIGIYEMLEVDDRFRAQINQDPSVGAMRQLFRESGRRTLFEDGLLKVKQGLTTLEEVLRVTEVYGHTQEEVFVENLG